MNKCTRTLTDDEYKLIILTTRDGFTGFKPNERVAMALLLEANLGIRISDIAKKLRLCDIIKDGTRYRLDITEQKTGKKRTFTVQNDLYNYIAQYCIDHNIKSHEWIVPLTERAIQKQLKIVTDYLGLENIGTQSFRKYFATNAYTGSGFNIILVQLLLQHSSPAITRRYIGISDEQVEEALKNNLRLI